MSFIQYFGHPKCKPKTKECLPRRKLQKYDPSICLKTDSDQGLQKAQLRLINLICNTSTLVDGFLVLK